RVSFFNRTRDPHIVFEFAILEARFDLIESDRNAEHAGRKGLKQQKRQDWRPTLSLLYFKFNPGGLSKAAP
ncbi:hypothetical protein U6W12_12185, partial [Brucella melitensis]|uniref:hypothetical protein n=1 Tax=Brucella melitensis TaxID=29459 RepID=UPI00398B37B5